MKKINLRNYILLGVLAFLAISSVAMTIETAVSSVEISKLQDKEQSLSMEKRSLEETLVKTLSMGALSEKSTEMGFVKPDNLVYVAPSEAVAKLP